MTETAVVVHDSDATTAEQLKEAIEDCGFDGDVLTHEVIPASNGSEVGSGVGVDSLLPKMAHTSLKIYGMTCTNCSNTIESGLNKLDGIISCNVMLSTEEASIEYNPDIIGIREIFEKIEDFGFEAILNNNLDNSAQLDSLSKIKDIQYWKLNFFKCLLLGAPVILLGHILPQFYKNRDQKLHASIGPSLIPGLYLDQLIELVPATYIQFILGKRFYLNAYKSLKHGSGTMDLLICISTSLSYFYSVFIMLYAVIKKLDTAPEVLFETSAMLFIFISFGKWLENKAKGQTSSALSRLLSLTPSTCTIIDNISDQAAMFDINNNINQDANDLSTKIIPIELLQKGDIVIVTPGSRVPTDGECIFGESEVDESLLTGESLPIYKCKGSNLVGGSVNGSNTLYLKVVNVGESTQLQQIVKLVKDAQISKPPIQRVADVIATKFVPTILVLAVLTFVVWSMILKCLHTRNEDYKIPKYFSTSDSEFTKILLISISVVVVACPCALGLAAPTAIMVGTGVGASHGVLIKGGDVLERANEINCILFDKTGTITTGKFKLHSYKFLPSEILTESDIWEIIGSIEQNSEHPLGKSITKSALEKLKLDNFGSTGNNLIVEKFETLVGLGISTHISYNDKKLLVKFGNFRMLNENDITNMNDFLKTTKDSEVYHELSNTVSHILINNEYYGYVELIDGIRPDSKATISFLLKEGYSVAMVTGDSEKPAKRIGRLVGIPEENIYSSVTAEGKQKLVENLQNEMGLKIAFVGDGINDAPALVKADLGIAINTGTDIAIDAADIVLLGGGDNHVDDVINNAERNGGNVVYESRPSSSLTPVASESNNVFVENANNTKVTRSSLGGIASALSISNVTFKRIKLNFLWAMIYNLIMLPLSMGFLIFPLNVTLDPMLASAAMAFSSISIVVSSLLLKRWQPPKLDDESTLSERRWFNFYNSENSEEFVSSGSDSQGAFDADLENPEILRFRRNQRKRLPQIFGLNKLIQKIPLITGRRAEEDVQEYEMLQSS
ncbi:hypothetical protein PACTADRAFT_49233 [Pachysolen tannophilus NRRL Y-2460]|uniref:P-type Cu(+) transporter n=1 Tax=Pachysolen tannophilus NRRL Y-2460 TaxID=669874 RepID=A0A1E4TVJ1_PACTA|nr:hypothetical protein PACTADRAFT_49233 [Pachysolen tannophilus NRRL Y-2460]